MENKQVPVLFLGLSKMQMATMLAIFFHAIGLVGILFFDKSMFANTTSFHLLLMFGLILYTHRPVQLKLGLFFLIIYSGGLLVEWIGTQTGWLFGSYAYGQTLGVSFMHVPLIIGLNWCIIIYCCGVSIHMLTNHLMKKIPDSRKAASPLIKKWSIILDGALIALLFDWLMEPVAIQLGYWQWLENGTIPLYNYLSWFIISMIFLFIFQQFNIKKTNKFAVHLLLIQTMFFLLLRTFL